MGEKESKGAKTKRLRKENERLMHRSEALAICLYGIVTQFDQAMKQLPAEAASVLKHYFAGDIAASKLALSALEATDLRALAQLLSDSGWEQPDPVKNKSRPTWEVVIDDLTPFASSPATSALLIDMAHRSSIVAVQPDNGRDALWDLYEQQLDAIVYAMQLAQEQPEDEWPRQVYFEQVQLALHTRRRILIAQMSKQLEADPGVGMSGIREGEG